VQDVVPSSGEAEGPLRQDFVRPALERVTAPVRRLWQDNRRATVILVAGFLVAIVAPALLCVRGWHEAESIRGVGAGRGWFTVASCGDQQVYMRGDEDEHATYTCTGTFDGPSVSGVQTSLSAVNKYYEGGDRVRARITGDGHVSLANGAVAAMVMASWFVAACAVARAEVIAVRMLDRRIRGVPQTKLWPVVGPPEPRMGLRLTFTIPFVLFLAGMTWALAFFPLMIAWWGQ
jgi:hypothetical protein